MKIAKSLSYPFSQIYDLITVGPYANTVGNIVNYRMKNNFFTNLAIQQQPFITQPTLFKEGQPKMILNSQSLKGQKSLDYGVKEINAQKSKITLKNGKQYRYKQLVYSGSSFQWRNFNYLQKYMTNSTKTERNYGEHDFYNLNYLYQIKNGVIVFFIPKERHFGYDNYFMMRLRSYLQKDAKIKVLNEGSSLFPFQDKSFSDLEQLLNKNNIQLINNCSIQSLDFKNKKLKLNGQEIKFDGFFSYEPLKTPQILSKSNIDPFKVQPTLENEQFRNIYVLGNIFNNAYSFDALKKMSKVIADNIEKTNLGIRLKSQYLGESNIHLWTSKNSLIYLQTKNQELLRYFGSNILLGSMLGMKRKLSYEMQIRSFLNSAPEQKDEKKESQFRKNIQIQV